MAFATGEVKLPLVGGVSKRSLLIGGGLAGAVILALWWRNRSTGAPVDEAAAEDLGPDAEDLSGLGSGGTGGGTSVGAGGTTIEAAPQPVRTNAEWRAVVMEALAGVVDESKLSAALGLYLTGGAVAHGSVEESLIQQARSAADDPPVDGPNGYPPAIRYQAATGQTPPKPSPTPAPKPTPKPAPAKKKYTVKSGDTLTSIGAKQRPKVSATALYNANKKVIEDAAHKHGRSSSDRGHWIYPGTVLTIP